MVVIAPIYVSVCPIVGHLCVDWYFSSLADTAVNSQATQKPKTARNNIGHILNHMMKYCPLTKWRIYYINCGLLYLGLREICLSLSVSLTFMGVSRRVTVS